MVFPQPIPYTLDAPGQATINPNPYFNFTIPINHRETRKKLGEPQQGAREFNPETNIEENISASNKKIHPNIREIQRGSQRGQEIPKQNSTLWSRSSAAHHRRPLPERISQLNPTTPQPPLSAKQHKAKSRSLNPGRPPKPNDHPSTTKNHRSPS